MSEDEFAFDTGSEDEFAFDTGKVRDIEDKLKKKKKTVDNVLKDLERQVKEIKGWWEGPSAVGDFVDSFLKSTKTVSTAIDEWLKQEKECIAEAQQRMDDLDRGLKIESQAATGSIGNI